MGYSEVERVLVDARNAEMICEVASQIREAIGRVGVDCETQDTERHAGLNRFCGYREDGSKAANKSLVFDTRKTVITGFSTYIEGDTKAYYFNLAHADVENRLRDDAPLWSLFEAISNAKVLAHNAAYEIMAFTGLLTFKDITCTMQLATSAYGPDEYSREDFLTGGIGTLASKFSESVEVCQQYTGDRNGDPEVGKLFASVLSKESHSASSYNGFVKDLAYGYGLKKAVQKFCGYTMSSYQDTLGENTHMGQLTGEQATYYGCDDAIWCVRLAEKLFEYLLLRSPEVVETFFAQENPMVAVFAQLWTNGCKINLDAVKVAQGKERIAFYEVIRELHRVINERLPFQTDPHEGLLKYERWYQSNWAKYRGRLEAFANAPFPTDVYAGSQMVRSPVSNAWAAERKLPESSGLNLGHYMPMRVLLYDLLQLDVMTYQGKVQSDAEARGALLETAVERNHPAVDILKPLSELSRVDQVMKLYLNPYLDLTDPETQKVYPVVSSELATRRMASKHPNSMQLSKYGKSNYVRGFYLPDQEDHVLVSMDWSGIELVVIGELSQDPVFREAYAQLPHGDLHIAAAAEVLDASVETLKAIKNLPEDYDEPEYQGVPLIDYRGRPLTPSQFWKYARSTDVGKGANFNYWYSGSLNTIASRHRWTKEQMWEITDRYRNKFSVAEQWRLLQLHELRSKGYVKLPDLHRRYRYECTEEWKRGFLDKFRSYDQGVLTFWSQCADSIQRRAGNQGVNALVQGTNATIAKRSILYIESELRSRGWEPGFAAFKFPIHDELVYSVQKDLVRDFLGLAVPVMKDHPDIFPTLKLDVGVSVGLTFQPYHVLDAPTGQIELSDVPAIPGVVAEGGVATGEDIDAIVSYLVEVRRDLNA